MSELAIIADGAVLIDGEKIVAVGTTDELARHELLRSSSRVEEVDCRCLSPNSFRIAGTAHRRWNHLVIGRHAGERLGLISQVLEQRPGEMIAAIATLRGMQRD